MKNSGVQNSLAYTIAKKIVGLRLLVIPRGSRREVFYVRFVRPILSKLLGHGCTSEAFQQAVMQSATVSAVRPAQFQKESVSEILIIKCDHIGDFFLSLQAFSIVRKGFPKAKLTLMCGSWNRDLALKTGLFDRVVCADVHSEISSGGTVPYNVQLLDTFHFPVFDIAIDMKPESDTRFFLNHVQARLKAGFEDQGDGGEGIILVTDNEMKPMMDFMFQLPSLGCQGKMNYARHTQTLLASFVNGIVNLFDSTLAVSEILAPLMAEPHSVLLTRRGEGPLIAINPGSGALTKNWPIENYQNLIKDLIQLYDATIVLLGSGHQKEYGIYLTQEVPDSSIINLIGTLPLVELPNVVRQLDLYIGHDTGGTHIASMVGQKTLCLYSGVGPLEAFGLVGKNVIILKCFNLPCSPCHLTKLDLCDFGHICMHAITPKRVLEEIESMLNLKSYPSREVSSMNG
jgi:ADP-heptose:LPS heptosyltransferase